MNRPFCLALATSLFLAGCGEKSATTPAASTNSASTGNPLDAPGNYLKAIADGKQSAVKTVDVTSLKKAIELFNVDQGRNPKDLQELVEKKYMPQLPAAPFGSKLVYDANAGTVEVVKQ
ncbi:MAG TPA: hypothetical protein VN578_14455 [Candidatus Binatia bacterium]|nr:hypothetical protein [Candidatus Binatia bacterium]